MNKVLILILMMLSFVSEDGKLQKTPTEAEATPGKTEKLNKAEAEAEAEAEETITPGEIEATATATTDKTETTLTTTASENITTNTTETTKQIQQNTSTKNPGETKKPKQNTTTAPTTTGGKKPIKTKKLNEAKEEETIIPGEIEAILATIEDEKLIKTKKLNEAKGGASFLTQHKKKILFTAAFLAFLAIIFGINHLKGKNSEQKELKEKQKEQQKEQQLTPQQKPLNPIDESNNINNNNSNSSNSNSNRVSNSSQLQQQEPLKEEQLRPEQEQKGGLIKTEFKGKSYIDIFETLYLYSLTERTLFRKFQLLTRAIIQEEGSPELTRVRKAVIEVLKGTKDIEDIEDIENDGSLKEHIKYVFTKNATQVNLGNEVNCSDKDTKKVTYYNQVIFSNSNTGKKYYFCKSKQITIEGFQKIKKLINAILKLRDILLNPDSDLNETNLTLIEIKHLFGINYYNDILQKTPLEANEYIGKIERALEEILENNKETMKLVREAKNKIEEAIQESNKLKESDLCLGFDSNLGCFSLYCNLRDYKSCGEKGVNHMKPGDNSPVGKTICSDLYQKLTKSLEKEVVEEVEAQTIKETLNKICEITGDLNDTKLKGGTLLTQKYNTITQEINKELMKQYPEKKQEESDDEDSYKSDNSDYSS